MRTLPIVLTVSMVGACGGGSSVLDGMEESPGTVEDMREWADGASAPAVYAQALMPIFLAGFAGQESTCPVITEGATETTYEGGCTDDEGNEWIGRATASAGQPGAPSRIDFDGFGFTGDIDGCPGMRATTTWQGTFDQTSDGAAVAFEIDVQVEGDGFDVDDGCAPLTDTIGIEYAGTYEEPSDGVNVFSGSGRIGSSSRGVVSASTEDEVVDQNTCSNEAMSGTTTITASGHTAVIRYDGATDCDDTSTVTWTYDGEDQGELEGVSCSSGGGTSGLATVLLLALVTACGTARRGRSRTDRRASLPRGRCRCTRTARRLDRSAPGR